MASRKTTKGTRRTAGAKAKAPAAGKAAGKRLLREAGRRAIEYLQERDAAGVVRELTAEEARALIKDFDPAGQVAYVLVSRASSPARAEAAKTAKAAMKAAAVTMVAVAPKKKPFG